MFCLTAAMLGSCQLIAQEKLYKVIPKTPPIFGIGIEGSFGTLTLLLVLPVVVLLSDTQHLLFKAGLSNNG